MSTWQPEADVILTDSEDEENDFKRDFHGRQAMLFVVDANLYANPERFLQALEIIRGAFISGLMINDKDLLGIMFANTACSPEPYEPNCLENISVPEHCAVFLPLRQLTKAIVEHYLRFLQTAVEDFGTQYGIAANGGCGNFATMIRLCVNLFDNCGYSLNNSTIVFMTDRETPHPPHTREYQIALQKARDLDGREVGFRFIPMIDDFDYEVFYKEFLTLAWNVELDSFVVPDAQQLREILADRKLTQDFLKRCLGHFNLSLGPNLELSVQYYNYFQRRAYPRKVKLLRKDNSLIKQRHAIMVRKQDTETLQLTQEHEVKSSGGWYEIHLGDRPIRITPEQVNRVRNLHAPGMMLLGFKPRSELSPNMYYKPCNFMYPDDQSVIGSKRLFRALWQRCYERGKIAVCLFMRKKKSIPRYVALVPVAATDNESKDFRSLLSGDGFKIVYLPMAKHMRHIDFGDWNFIENTSPSEGVSLFERIIKKLRVKYKPNLINDPVLEQLQANLLALALNIQTDNDGIIGMHDTAMQDSRICSMLPDLDATFGVDVEPAKKRAAPKSTEGGGTASKVAKITDDDIKSFSYVQQLVANNSLSSCTRSQLQLILSEHFNVTSIKSAKKPVLIDRICELSK